MSPHIIGVGIFFGDSGDLWRHHGGGIGLPPSSSRFEHDFTGLIVFIYNIMHILKQEHFAIIM